jgi:hypothetical protein
MKTVAPTLVSPRIPATEERVPAHTADQVNERIRHEMEARVLSLAEGPAEGITRRLEELDREWDVERVLETNASSAVLVTATLAVFEDRRWGLLTMAVGAFLLQHAIQGWCPPLPVLRRIGFRTTTEIHEERLALRILRGDFADPMNDAEDAISLARES